MSSNVGSIVKWGAIAAGAWWVYENYFAGAVPASPVSPTPPVAAAPNPNAITGANTLDGIYSRMVAAAKAPAAGLSVDQWDAFLMQAQPSITAPDPMPIFTAAVPGFDRSQLVTGAQYWAVMAPVLKTTLGLSGIGHFAGLGRFVWGVR